MTEAPAILHATSFWEEPKNKLESIKAPRRGRNKLAGSYIHDLIGLGKAITLCKKCQGKFNAPGNGYERFKEVNEDAGFDYCISQCQDCNESLAKCNTFLKSSRI